MLMLFCCDLLSLYLARLRLGCEFAFFATLMNLWWKYILLIFWKPVRGECVRFLVPPCEMLEIDVLHCPLGAIFLRSPIKIPVSTILILTLICPPVACDAPAKHLFPLYASIIFSSIDEVVEGYTLIMVGWSTK